MIKSNFLFEKEKLCNHQIKKIVPECDSWWLNVPDDDFF